MGTKQQSSLIDEVSKAQQTLQCLFEEIGFVRSDRDDREASLFAALNAALREQMRSVVLEKNSLVEECNRVISSIKQMERSLDENKSSDELRVAPPLLKCLEGLKSKLEGIKVRHAERYTAVRELAGSLERYAERMEPSIIQIPLPPATNDSSSIASFDLSYAYYERLDSECNRIYSEYTKRIATVTSLSKDIISLYAELGVPNAQTDRNIIEFGSREPEKLGLKLHDLQKLRGKKEKLVGEMERRKEKVDNLKHEIGELWEKLGIQPAERKRFLAQHRGYNLKVIHGLAEELERMMELKRENLQVFVEDARQILQDLWDKLYFSDDQIMEFEPGHSDVYTDALLTAHEMEIRRLQIALEERTPMINMIEKHRSLVDDREQLALSATDSSRLISRGGSGNRDPTRLLREEKMRKRTAKELPKVEVELKKALEEWEEEHGEPFLVNGIDYLQTLMKMSPLLQSRVGAKSAPAPAANNAPKPGRWNPPATCSIQRARSNTASSAAPRPASRAKTPNAPQVRSKTPTGGPAVVAASVGRTGGRNMTVTVHRSGAKTPGPSGRIPASGTVPRSPARARTPLSIFPEGSNSPERRAPPSLARSQSAKHTQRGGLSVGSGSISRMTQFLPPPSMVMTPQNTIPPYLRQQQEKERQRPSTTPSVSREGTLMSVRSVSPEEMWKADGEKRTPRPKSFPPRAVGYSCEEREGSSSNGDSESTRLFSGSSSGTTGTTVSSSGNWEAFGDETEDEGSVVDHDEYCARAQYDKYGAKQRVPGRSSVMVHAGGNEDEWLSETPTSRY